MRKNLTKKKIEEKKTVFGVFVGVWSPAIVEVIGSIGFDFIIFDAEHGSLGPETFENLVRAAELADITPIVRVPTSSRQNVLRFLDLGAQGIQMPMVNTKDDAENLVNQMKYPPVGIRGLAGVRANNYGRVSSLVDYTKEANEETLVIAQIETVQAVKNAKEIISVPGIDIIFIGPTDLSTSMGYPGQTNHQEVVNTIDYLIKEIHTAGKAAGTVAYDSDILRKCKAMAFESIAYNVWPMLTKSGREYIEIARE